MFSGFRACELGVEEGERRRREKRPMPSHALVVPFPVIRLGLSVIYVFCSTFIWNLQGWSGIGVSFAKIWPFDFLGDAGFPFGLMWTGSSFMKARARVVPVGLRDFLQPPSRRNSAHVVARSILSAFSWCFMWPRAGMEVPAICLGKCSSSVRSFHACVV